MEQSGVGAVVKETWQKKEIICKRTTLERSGTMKICKSCHFINDGKKWFYDEAQLSSLLKKKEFEYVLCEACRRMRDKIICGVVYLEGEIILRQADEIIKMLRHEERIEQTHNHLSRIFDIRKEDNRLVIETLNEQLATHIGRQMKKRYKGHLEIAGGISGHRSRSSDDREEVIVKWRQGS